MAHGALVTVAMMVASYYLVYVVSPYEVEQHIATSFIRILFQPWPTFIWAAAMLVRAPIGLTAREPDRVA